jgi:hypothetical protein
VTRRLSLAGRRVAHPTEHDGRGSTGAAFGSLAEGDAAIVNAALARLADEIADEGMAALVAHLDWVGLPADLSKAHELRAAIQEVVIKNLRDALGQRVAEIESDPTMVASLRGSGRREALLAIIQRYARE